MPCQRSEAHPGSETLDHLSLKVDGDLKALEQCADGERLCGSIEDHLEVVSSRDDEIRLTCPLAAPDAPCYRSKGTDEAGGDIPGRREDGSTIVVVLFEDPTEPGEATSEVVELAGLIGRPEDAAVLAQLPGAVPVNERGAGIVAECVDDEAGIGEEKIALKLRRGL